MSTFIDFFKTNTDNYIVEFSASIIGWIFSLVFVSWITARRKRNQFYKNLNPVMKTLSLVREKTKLDSRYIQAIVQSISNSFEEDFIKTKWYDFIPLHAKKSEIFDSECWVCDSTSIKKDNECAECELDCKAWDKSTLPKQMQIEKAISEI